ncbi:hypothetical protein GCM10017621_21030 [Maricaulis virginensis]|uniref:Uncharacterized protein n=1 Tax=Maricaulis virginensis TaxID=144022 RepID=A0A9W6INW9_9PROT|nr:hypothetical protein GCM10017621_21030 [Maricaulis virginensis]
MIEAESRGAAAELAASPFRAGSDRPLRETLPVVFKGPMRMRRSTPIPILPKREQVWLRNPQAPKDLPCLERRLDLPRAKVKVPRFLFFVQEAS